MGRAFRILVHACACRGKEMLPQWWLRCGATAVIVDGRASQHVLHFSVSTIFAIVFFFGGFVFSLLIGCGFVAYLFLCFLCSWSSFLSFVFASIAAILLFDYGFLLTYSHTETCTCSDVSSVARASATRFHGPPSRATVKHSTVSFFLMCWILTCISTFEFVCAHVIPSARFLPLSCAVVVMVVVVDPQGVCGPPVSRRSISVELVPLLLYFLSFCTLLTCPPTLREKEEE
ncbi:hypothetical protein ABL78_8332 [Leptomonas seymouri]|uniref:Uncharacterized protein n=1 Tax=Leptomonas seymouri TaxID=5684 RepID=A0A0N1IH61_LEPSE|nr:hypothetical protein ABL78_8332 [Leptomonas seymouri]|eukprot:KPI82655.1 hypothetical protein ABL78_8332 [Leptomonas seymouri]